jgi:hypothetical protein
MRRDVRWALARDPQRPPTGVIITLHGRGNNRLAAFDVVHLHGAVAAAGDSFAVVGVDGGAASYWHARRERQRCPHDVARRTAPGCRRACWRRTARAVIGWSMGCYGALLANRKLVENGQLGVPKGGSAPALPCAHNTERVTNCHPPVDPNDAPQRKSFTHTSSV